MTGKHLIYGLAYECPFFERKDNCVLTEIDSLSFKEKVDWINGLDDLLKRSIWERHLICSQIRDNKESSFVKDEIS